MWHKMVLGVRCGGLGGWITLDRGQLWAGRLGFWCWGTAPRECDAGTD
jgi:hypothetical protein